MKSLRSLLARPALWLAFAATAAVAPAAQALTPAQAGAIAAGETDSRIEALGQAAASGDADLAAFVRALLDDQVKLAGDKAYVVSGDQVVLAGSNAPATLPADAEDVVNNNRMR
ncbi:MAG: hypothetical protein RJA44_170, partial [Pseudomonadota bacterium]